MLWRDLAVRRTFEAARNRAVSASRSFAPTMTLHARTVAIVAALVLSAGCRTLSPRAASGPPRTGDDVLARMADAYRGKWVSTLTFVQQTAIRRPDGSEQLATWHEAFFSPDRLRIDFGNPTSGNSSLYTATNIDFREEGISRQREEYTDWVVDPPLSLDFFVAERYGSVPHWADAEPEIRAELDSTAAGWNRGDLARYLAAYIDSATATSSTGSVRGRGAIEAQMRRGFWQAGRPEQALRYERVEIRMIGVASALVTGQFVLSGAGRPDRTGWFTTVWTKTPAGWRMLHDHSG